MLLSIVYHTPDSCPGFINILLLLVGVRTQSIRRSTVIGRIMS